MTLVDLSHPVLDKAPCTFTLVDKVPSVVFEEGDSHGMFFVTSEVLGLASNVCTHIDFPGHLDHLRQEGIPTVGDYPLERFVGPVAILDVAPRMAAIRDYFDEEGFLAIDAHDGTRMLAFLHALDELEVYKDTLLRLVSDAGATLPELKGILFSSGMSLHWRYETLDSWRYLYFFNPFLSDDACQTIVDAGISFVGIDAFQLEHPMINFRGDELPVILNDECREFVYHRLRSVSNLSNHTTLLGNDVLIYENLRIPPTLRGSVLPFAGPPLNLRLNGLTDNAVARPYVLTSDRQPQTSGSSA